MRKLLLTAVLTATVGLGASAPAGTAVSACRPTLSQGGGPFDTVAAPIPRRTRIGRGHILTGRILRAPDCRPVRGVLVELWQASANGRYDRRGQASMVTAGTGRFTFEGPVPPGEFGRPPHIHIRVTAPGYEDFVTTYFLARGERLGRMTIVIVSAV